MSKLQNLIKPPSSQELPEMYDKGELVLRTFALRLSAKDGELYSLEELELELEHLQDSVISGTHNNVTREGNRNRSISIPVKGTHTHTYQPVGFLYKKDGVTIKARGLTDMGTTSQIMLENPKIYGQALQYMPASIQEEDGNEYNNIIGDRNSFLDADLNRKRVNRGEPPLSKQEIISTLSGNNFNKLYVQYDKDRKDGRDRKEIGRNAPKRNEALANIFPESLVGIVGKDSSLSSKLGLLMIQNNLKSQYDITLATTMITPDKLEIYNPDLKEISNLLNEYKQALLTKDYKKINMAILYPSGDVIKRLEDLPPQTVLKDLANQIGFDIDISTDKDIRPEDLVPLDKNSLTVKNAVIKSREMLQLSDDDKNNEYIKEALLKSIHTQREKDGDKQIDNIDYAIISKQDVDKFVKEEQKGMNHNVEAEIQPQFSKEELQKLENDKKNRDEAEKQLPEKYIRTDDVPAEWGKVDHNKWKLVKEAQDVWRDANIKDKLTIKPPRNQKKPSKGHKKPGDNEIEV